MQVAYLKETDELLIPRYPQATFTQIAEVQYVVCVCFFSLTNKMIYQLGTLLMQSDDRKRRLLLGLHTSVKLTNIDYIHYRHVFSTFIGTPLSVEFLKISFLPQTSATFPYSVQYDRVKVMPDKAISHL